MAKTQTQTQTQTQNKAANKAANNTPVSSFATYLAKVTDSKKANALKEVHAKEQAKKEQAKGETKKGIFSLVAGTIVKIENKMLKKAIEYHCKQGNLCKVSEGIKLTAQGAAKWTAERIATDPAQFNEIAKALHGKGEMYKAWNRQPVAKVNDSIRFPNCIYWGSFARSEMRQAFSAIWAK